MRRRTAAVLAALILGVLAPVGAATPALACSCAAATDAEHAARAHAIFTGLLVDREEPGPGISSGETAILTFEVLSVHKGDVAAREQVVTVASGASCGLELSGLGPHLVFASTRTYVGDPSASPGTLRANLCGGSRPLAAGPLDPALGTPREPDPGSEQATGDAVGSATWPVALGVGATGGLAALAGLVVLRRRRTP